MGTFVVHTRMLFDRFLAFGSDCGEGFYRSLHEIFAVPQRSLVSTNVEVVVRVSGSHKKSSQLSDHKKVFQRKTKKKLRGSLSKSGMFSSGWRSLTKHRHTRSLQRGQLTSIDVGHRDSSNHHFCSRHRSFNLVICPNHNYDFHPERNFGTSGGGFSSTWQTTDQTVLSTNGNEEEEEDFIVQTPDPFEYLNGFDSVSVTSTYKQAILDACEIQSSHHMLDVGCGTATHIPAFSNAVGTNGTVTAIDISQEFIQRAQQEQQQDSKLNNVQFQVANVYQLPYRSRTFDIVKEDRVFQHLVRPWEAVQEMVRVVKPGGTIVIANPDFYTFVMDPILSQYHSQQHRWNQIQRSPPSSHDYYDMEQLTTKVLNGVIPTLCIHPAIGSQLSRLLYAAGLYNIQVQVIPLLLNGRQDLEKIVPITYMAQLSYQNGYITKQEMTSWLERLQWEGDDSLSGTLNMYIARGKKPSLNEDDTIDWKNSNGQVQFYQIQPTPKLKHDVHIRIATTDDADELIEEARGLINNEYATSDTGTTLSSTRLRPQDIQTMVQDGELLLAFDEDNDDLVGCIQVKIKYPTENDTTNDDGSSSGGGGLPTFGDDDDNNDNDQQKRDNNAIVGEFTCLAVSSNIHARVHNANTQNVTIERMERTDTDTTTSSSSRTDRRGGGIGAALVRAAEAHARNYGAVRMTLGIMCPAEYEPPYKVWLQDYYRKLGYEYQSTIVLDFEKDPTTGKVIVDQLHDMYEPLHQLVQCKAILFDKRL